jgi:aminoglycoside phosphotransferase (APT) family kinase protein/ADP-ribose pyrophosphatase YjhB (NUDIX family)
MTPDDARAALATAGLTPSGVVPIGDGEASWTFELDGSRIAQFPRNELVARGHARARRLLPELAGHVSFAVPQPETVGEWNGLSFHVYKKVPGTPLSDGALSPEALAALLTELHSFPVDRARNLLSDEGTVDEWRAGYESLWLDVEERVLPLLSEALARAVEREYAIFLREAEFHPVLVHRDLGVEHILIGPQVAIIDFEEVAVGDPAIDFVGIFASFGLTAARAVIEQYGRVDPDFAGRMRFYRWMGSVHAALYALDIDDPELLAGAIEQIEVRIADRPRASAAVLRGDRILMVRYLDQFWTLPGGGIEPGEGWEDAALRELREEAGISGGVVRELYRRTYGQGSEVCFLVESDGEPAVTNDPDITAVRWFPLDDLAHDMQVSRVLAALRAP